MKTTWLQAKRIEKRLTLSDIERLTGLERTYVNRLERYKRHARKDTIEKYLEALGITYDEYEQAYRERRMAYVRTLIEPAKG